MRVVVGITGGIAAYKAVQVVRSFVLDGHDVTVVPTEAALRFVGRPTLEAISRNPVSTDLFDGVAEVRHVALGQHADLIVIAPATANTIAKLAAGIADDLLGTTVLASRAPLVIAPAMHTEMWGNPATRANIRTLVARGVTVVGPAEGRLTGEDAGAGRMAEPAEIVAAALAVAAGPTVEGASVNAVSDALAGRRVLVTAGGTREPLDPVRFIGNRSSGRLGVAIAEAAAARGAAVTLIAAHLEIDVTPEVAVRPVETTAELLAAVNDVAATADLVIMAAAVADFRPAETASGKIKKSEVGEHVTVDLVQNPDVLRTLVAARATDGPAHQVIVGFAAETEPDRDRRIALGRAKLAAKGCDFLVLNEVGWHAGFGDTDTAATVIRAGGEVVGSTHGDKVSVASGILDLVAPA